MKAGPKARWLKLSLLAGAEYRRKTRADCCAISPIRDLARIDEIERWIGAAVLAAVRSRTGMAVAPRNARKSAGPVQPHLSAPHREPRHEAWRFRGRGDRWPDRRRPIPRYAGVAR